MRQPQITADPALTRLLAVAAVLGSCPSVSANDNELAQLRSRPLSVQGAGDLRIRTVATTLVPQRKPLRIRIATWHLDGTLPPEIARLAGSAKREPSGRPVWRNTFGPRKVRRPTSTDQTVIINRGRPSPDIVALQGVRDFKALRRIFSARRYYLITSRQMLRLRGSNATTTAIAVRRDSGLRVRAQKHLFKLALDKTGKPTSTIDPARHLKAGVAIRVVKGPHSFWVLSVDLASSCPNALEANGAPISPAAPECDNTASTRQANLVRDWILSRRARGEPAIVAGHFPNIDTPASSREMASFWDVIADVPTVPMKQPADSRRNSATPRPVVDTAKSASEPSSATPRPSASSGQLTFFSRLVPSSLNRIFSPNTRRRPGTSTKPTLTKPSDDGPVLTGTMLRFPIAHAPSPCVKSSARTHVATSDVIIADVGKRERRHLSAKGWAMINRQSKPVTADNIAPSPDQSNASPSSHCPVTMAFTL